MASSGARVKGAADPWMAWDEALEQVPLPRDPQTEFFPMPAFLQEILDSFVDFDAEPSRLDLPRGNGGHPRSPRVPKLRAGTRKSPAA